MKLSIIAAALLAGAALAQAQVPGLINYQGRLTTPSGVPASGTKNFALSIFDSETGGTLLYNEAVGPVTLDAAGVYSFQFGTTGTSNTQVVETLATTDGTASSFQKVLANTGVVAGSLSVTDGTYTWSQAAGSSNEDDFGVAYSSSLRRVTVSYFSAPPAAGRPITATYRYATPGISGAISAGSQHWMAISIDGVAQAGRQRVLAVPFAMQAGFAAMAGDVVEKAKVWRPSLFSMFSTPPPGNPSPPEVVRSFPIYGSSGSYYSTVSGTTFDIPSHIKKIAGFNAKFWIRGYSEREKAKIVISVESWDPVGGQITLFTEEFMASQIEDQQHRNISRKLDVIVNNELIYKVSVSIHTPYIQNSGSSGAVYDMKLSIVE